jgi:hypothetical protein
MAKQAKRSTAKKSETCGKPIRKKSDVLFWTGAQIADWYRGSGPKAP